MEMMEPTLNLTLVSPRKMTISWLTFGLDLCILRYSATWNKSRVREKGEMGYSLSKAINTSVVIITVANVHISILYLKPSLVHFNVHRSVFLTTRSHQNAFCKILQSLDTVTSNKISLIYCFKLGEMTRCQAEATFFSTQWNQRWRKGTCTSPYGCKCTLSVWHVASLNILTES